MPHKQENKLTQLRANTFGDIAPEYAIGDLGDRVDYLLLSAASR
jgi:hypothetical protein